MGTILLWVAVVLLAASVFVLAARKTKLEDRLGELEHWAHWIDDPEYFGNPVPDPEAEALVLDCQTLERLHVPVTEGGKSCQHCRAVLA